MRLIDADEAIINFGFEWDDIPPTREEFAYFLKKQPTINAVPVRHGRWDDEHKCTVCHNEAFYKISNIRPDYDYDWEENLVETGDYIWAADWLVTTYCPHCGAKMMEG